MIECQFATACMKYFGMRPGQNLTQFQAELRELTEKDRADFIAWFPSVGYKIIINP